jgi:hypothetical protein
MRVTGEMIDQHFYEFWGNVFMNAARGQKRMEDLARWMGQGLKGFEEFTGLLRTCYGLDRGNGGGAEDSKPWEAAARDFQASFKDWISLYGFVPRQEYLALVEKYEALKERARTQQETIDHLRQLCKEKLLDPSEMVKGFQDLLQDQSDQFRKLMEDLWQPSRKEDPDSKGVKT